jgi:hypothetical protein
MAYFAVMMKAREYNRRILNGENTCKVYSIKESNGITDAALDGMGNSLSEDERKTGRKEIKALIAEFKDAKEYGSILNIKKRDWDLLRRFAVPNMNYGQLALDTEGSEIAAQRLQEIIDVAEVMANQYMTTVTNPPYMTISNGSGHLNDYAKKYYPDSKSDMFAIFIEKCRSFTGNTGYQAMITQHSWMFLSSYEKLRGKLQSLDIVNMAHLGARAFEEIGGEVVQTTTFVFQKKHTENRFGIYCRLIVPTSQKGKEDMFLSGDNRYTSQQASFAKIPGAPVAYWASKDALEAYLHKNLDQIAQPRHGLATSDNDRFLKLWYEVDITKTSTLTRCDFTKKWYPMSKGGSFRKWYGNLDWLIDYENDGKTIKDYAISIYGNSSRTIQNTQFYFKKGLTWSALTSGGFSVRYQEKGALFGSGGYCAFSEDNIRLYILALMNSKVVSAFINFVSPTLNYEVGHIKTIPVAINESIHNKVEKLVEDNITVSKHDWDAFETSWDFESHPAVRKAFSRSHWGDGEDITLEYVYQFVAQDFEDRFQRLKENEEDLNRIFIDIYGLQDELTPEVEDKDVTVRHADLHRDIKSLLSFAIGCMFGRYSLNRSGIAYAGGVWDASKYALFHPDKDNVIPITDEEYMEDDIVSRLCTWLKVVFGETTLEQNLDYIAKAVGNKGNSSREIIRNYFLNDFFKDHCQTYSVSGSGKRPIYWLFDSGKQNGFKALIYLHRYNADTIGDLRIDYLHRMQRIYESEISRMQDMIDHSTSSREVAQATKRREKLQKQLKECREYDERLAHLALSRIELDLDDGVKINYRKAQTANDGKFYEVLADSQSIMANDKLWKQYKGGQW